MFSPPVQPISSSTSGTGSVTTMWLDATASALRKPAKPAVALLTARTAAPPAPFRPASPRASRLTSNRRALVQADARLDRLRA